MALQASKPGRPKIHRSYTVEEVASLRGVHKNTVRNWLRQGLPYLAERRPLLILGRDLSEFESKRRRARKRPCSPRQIFCMRCREPREPVPGTLQFVSSARGAGSLSGSCSHCRALIFRRISADQLESDRAIWGVTGQKEQEHIDESDQPSVNCAFKQE